MKSFDDRLWSGISVSGIDDCWNWTRSKSYYGYGVIRKPLFEGGKLLYTHRSVYEAVRGPIPDGLDVCHTCDNPSCCNPIHLMVGTRTENINQAVERGRKVFCRRKCSNEDGRNIRTLYWDFGFSQYRIAKLFKISASAAWYAANKAKYCYKDAHPPN